MKIVFIQFSPYLPGFAYQENGLAKASVRCGNSTVFITTGYIPVYLREFVKDTEEFHRPVMVDDDGVKIYRQPFRWPWIPEAVNWRLRAMAGVQEILEKEQPDLIYYHGLTDWALFDVADYVRVHPACVLCGDSHLTYANSGKSFISKYLLHRMLYRYVLRKNVDVIQKFFYLTDEVAAFSRNEVGLNLPEEKMMILPLGDFVSPPEERPAIRRSVLDELHLPDDTILIVHSGKLVRGKRTKELLEALGSVKDDRMRLLIIGKIPSGYADELEEDIRREPRAIFLGWKTGAELRRYMIAGDLYAQPGTESSTLQSAMCCGSPVMLSPEDGKFKAYRSLFDDDKVLYVKTVEDMTRVLGGISANPGMLDQYREFSYQYARDLLDYEKQIEIICSVAEQTEEHET